MMSNTKPNICKHKHIINCMDGKGNILYYRCSDCLDLFSKEQIEGYPFRIKDIFIKMTTDKTAMKAKERSEVDSKWNIILR